MSSNAMFHVTVKGVIVIDGKMLLLKKIQTSKDHLGFWELPGGGMEYNETPIEAMQREAKEETGLLIEVQSCLSTFHVVRPAKQIVGMIFLCKALHHNIQLSEEHQDYVLVSQEEAKQYLDPKIYEDTFQGKEIDFCQ